MPLVKKKCPKCGQLLTIDITLENPTCPVCGAFLDSEVISSATSECPESTDECIKKCFRYLENKDFENLETLTSYLDNENFYSTIFSLIVKYKIDFIFNIPNIRCFLAKNEVEDDMKSRYYHYARKKYNRIPQVSYNKIAGIYADIPGESRGKWKRANTSFINKFNTISSFKDICDDIELNYLSDLKSKANEQYDKDIVSNLETWIIDVRNAYDEYKKYDDAANKTVIDDYNLTPNPGNSIKFSSYMFIYVLSFLGLSLNLFEMIVVLINKNSIAGVFSYLLAALSTLIYVAVNLIFAINLKLFKRASILMVSISVLSVVLCASYFASLSLTNSVGSIWFNITTIGLSLFSLVFVTFKLVVYFPRNTNKNGTIIGNFSSLVSGDFDVKFEYSFTPKTNKNYIQIKKKK